MNIKKYIIHLLFRLINSEPILKEDINEDKIQKWFELQANDPRVRDYIFSRNTTILRQIGQGLSRDDYLIWCGRRMETMNFLQKLIITQKKLEKDKGRNNNNKK